jgi:hypothetical protein
MAALQQAGGTRSPLTEDFITLTVWMTFFIGILFTVVGIRARQRWLVFWGVLTLIACAWYALYVCLA